MYDILFENDDFSGLKTFLSSRPKADLFILTDSNTALFCLPILSEALKTYPFKVLTVPAGEAYKNPESCLRIWSELLKYKTDKQAILMNLGGGVIGDMGGFCASCYKRGIDFIQIPTTLLSMVDASVGGKTGIDFENVKNALGLITEPSLVCIYDNFLKTLSERELRSGFAEIIKHALIADKEYWNSIRTCNPGSVPFGNFIRQSIEIKKSIVEKDPKEKGLRKILNFGHSIGHAIESLSLETEKPLLHGEAIAIGMICESFISTRVFGLDSGAFEEISNSVIKFFEPYNLKTIDRNKFFEYLKQDKKNKNNSIYFSLLDRIGHCEYDIQVDKKVIEESLDWYQLHFVGF